MTKAYTSGDGGSWEGSYRYFLNSSTSWFIRGGLAYDSTYYGITYSYRSNGGSLYSNSSRPVLAVSREFPWLSER